MTWVEEMKFMKLIEKRPVKQVVASYQAVTKVKA